MKTRHKHWAIEMVRECKLYVRIFKPFQHRSPHMSVCIWMYTTHGRRNVQTKYVYAYSTHTQIDTNIYIYLRYVNICSLAPTCACPLCLLHTVSHSLIHNFSISFVMLQQRSWICMGKLATLKCHTTHPRKQNTHTHKQ